MIKMYMVPPIRRLRITDSLIANAMKVLGLESNVKSDKLFRENWECEDAPNVRPYVAEGTKC